MIFDFFKSRIIIKNEVVIVLGMHRSGTSCLTGLLQQAGLELGDVVEEAPYNKKGNRENLDIMALNNDVLSYSHGSWDLPPVQLEWNRQHRNRRDEILSRFNNQPVWGFKDPRALLTLPFWLEGLRMAKVHYIGTFRHPLAVAKSLNSRQPDLSLEKGIGLWQKYNERLFSLYKEIPFPLVNFDLEPLVYLRAVQSALKKLSLLESENQKKLNFFDETLQHQGSFGAQELAEFSSLLEPVMPLYESLKSIFSSQMAERDQGT